MNSDRIIANRFEIQDLLRRGGMGGVYRAKDTQTGEKLAVKAINAEEMGQHYDVGVNQMGMGKQLSERVLLEKVQYIFTEMGVLPDLEKARAIKSELIGK